MSFQRRISLALSLLACLANNHADAFATVRQQAVGPAPIQRLEVKTRAIDFPSRSISKFRAEPSRTRLSKSMWSSDEDLEGTDRFKACVPYLLPLLDGEGFGRVIYEQVPPLGFLDSLFIGPLFENYREIPFCGLILFVALTIGTRGNTDMSRGVRFNAQQAAIIDVSLVAPELIELAFKEEDIPKYLSDPCLNFVWYVYMGMILYSIYSNLRGTKPDQIPWISGYADLLVGPF
jgi:hypothetical protein